MFFISDKLFSSLTELFLFSSIVSKQILVFLSLVASATLALKSHMQKDFPIKGKI